jgi:hypothetical protein
MIISLTLTRKEITYPLADIAQFLLLNHFDFVLTVRDVCAGKQREEECIIEVEVELLKTIYVKCFNYYIGMASYINPDMKIKIKDQLIPLANFAEMQSGAEPNEVAQFLLYVQQLDQQGAAAVLSKCDATDQIFKIPT